MVVKEDILLSRSRHQQRRTGTVDLTCQCAPTKIMHLATAEKKYSSASTDTDTVPPARLVPHTTAGITAGADLGVSKRLLLTRHTNAHRPEGKRELPKSNVMYSNVCEESTSSARREENSTSNNMQRGGPTNTSRKQIEAFKTRAVASVVSASNHESNLASPMTSPHGGPRSWYGSLL